MPTHDPRIDAYIAKAAPFAHPILNHLRALVHRALPEAQETIKWGMPHFTVAGKNVSGIAAFKGHCAIVIHGDGRQGETGGAGMGGYGRIASLADLPGDHELEAKVREAAQRVATSGTALKPKDRRPPKPAIPMPEDFAAALAGNASAKTCYDGFSLAQQREYLEWITTAKQAATREKRLAQAVEWLAEGKKRNWKYENC
jgi:uncharacterized protein YdeI (YjbR/CyaY-like superfamily)